MAKAVKIKPQTWRHVNRMLKEQAPARAITLPQTLGSTLVRVLNSSGVDCPKFGVLGISGTQINPAVYPYDAVDQKIVLTGVLPSKTTHSYGNFVICCTPIKNGGIGLAWADGVCWANVNFRHAQHRFADIAEGDVTRLETRAGGGACSILWMNTGDGSITRPAIVKFNSGASRGHITWIRLVDNSSHPMTGIIATFNPTTGAWTSLSPHLDGSSAIVSVYRYPTHVNNTMYGYQQIIAASYESDGVFVSLHTIPLQFDVYP